MKELRYGLVYVACAGITGCVFLLWMDKVIPGEFYGILNGAVGALAGIAVGRHMAEKENPLPEDPKEPQ